MSAWLGPGPVNGEHHSEKLYRHSDAVAARGPSYSN